MTTRRIVYSILNEIKELEVDGMEHDYNSIKGNKRGHGTSRNLNVVIISPMISFDMVKIVKGIFMSLGLVYFHIRSFLLINEQINNTEHN